MRVIRIGLITAFLITGLHVKAQVVNDSLVKEYYPGGAIKSELRYKDGKLNGYSVYYFENGAKESIVEYLEGVKNGELIGYRMDGTVEKIYIMKDGLKVLETKLDKDEKITVQFVYAENRLLYELHFQDGKLVHP